MSFILHHVHLVPTIIENQLVAHSEVEGTRNYLGEGAPGCTLR